ncbi:MAG: methyltransferase domain-containing protein [Phycisphaerae bacterium]
MKPLSAEDVREQVKDYYGKQLTGTDDLKTQACCVSDAPPQHIRDALPLIDDEIIDKFYGCGSPIPPALDGATVLDLGCGTGRDAYVCAKLVGPTGRVIGVDMTREQIDVARRHADAQARRFGHAASNVVFHHGCIEDLGGLGIADDSVDVVISNCVINLSPDKTRVFAEVFRVLKPGGELYFSDVFASRRVPASVRADPVMRGECLGGAMYIEDFRRMLRGVGCFDHRVVSSRRFDISDADMEARVGMVDFCAATIRAFKLDDLEDGCEDYGQVAMYRGTLPESPHAFTLDDHHVFRTGQRVPVCGNTASMVSRTRYGRHFEVIGGRATHLGRFDCSGGGDGGAPFGAVTLRPGGGCC